MLAIVSQFLSPFNAIAQVVWERDFSGDWQKHWQAQIYDGEKNISVVDDKGVGSYLRVTYRPGLAGPDGGAQFYSILPEAVQNYRTLFLSYRVRFSDNFEWVLGGKLPGFISGKAGDVTGGARPNGFNGFSSRYMWMKDELTTYLYVPTQRAVPPKNGKFGWEKKLGFRFVPGRWHHLVQKVQLNTPGKFDGSYEVWADGKRLVSVNKILYRRNAFSIQGIYFSTFYGGSGKEWAPKQSGNYADFAKFRVSTRYPAN